MRGQRSGGSRRVTIVVLVISAGEGAGAPTVLKRPVRFGEPWVAPVQAHSERIEQRTVVLGARNFPRVLKRPIRFGESWVAPVQAHSERIEQRTVVQGAR
ncbi:MAG: hypothetical protein EBU21_13295 [Proteobacteria bacterium]|nr:hypothetical protein [Pseudomonadota bacterium]